jgi:hypothetical protein
VHHSKIGPLVSVRVIRYRSGLVDMSASASSGHRRIGKDIMALAGQFVGSEGGDRTGELKLRGRLRPPLLLDGRLGDGALSTADGGQHHDGQSRLPIAATPAP